MRINDRIVIEESALEEQFIHGAGPGGQNVNKVATAVQLRLDLSQVTGLSDDAMARLRRQAGRRLTKDDVIIIEAAAHRTQKRNREDARRRLAQMIREALIAPKPRRATRPTRASVERRLASKKRRALLKNHRGTPPSD